MPIQPNTEYQPFIEQRYARKIRGEVAVYESPPAFFMDAGDLYDFIDLLSGKPLVEKVPYKEELAPRKFGAWKGKVWMATDFDDDQEIIELFEGSEISPDGEDD